MFHGCVCTTENRPVWRPSLLLSALYLRRRHGKHSSRLQRLSRHHPTHAPSSVWTPLIWTAPAWTDALSVVGLRDVTSDYAVMSSDVDVVPSQVLAMSCDCVVGSLPLRRRQIFLLRCHWIVRRWRMLPRHRRIAASSVTAAMSADVAVTPLSDVAAALSCHPVSQSAVAGRRVEIDYPLSAWHSDGYISKYRAFAGRVLF